MNPKTSKQKPIKAMFLYCEFFNKFIKQKKKKGRKICRISTGTEYSSWLHVSPIHILFNYFIGFYLVQKSWRTTQRVCFLSIIHVSILERQSNLVTSCQICSLCQNLYLGSLWLNISLILHGQGLILQARQMSESTCYATTHNISVVYLLMLARKLNLSVNKFAKSFLK